MNKAHSQAQARPTPVKPPKLATKAVTKAASKPTQRSKAPRKAAGVGTPKAATVAAAGSPAADVKVATPASKPEAAAKPAAKAAEPTPAAAKTPAPTSQAAAPRLAVVAPASAAPASSGQAGGDGQSRTFRDDPSLDRRIIEGMLDDKDSFLDVMHGKGYGRDAVVRRAAELGLSEALIRQVKGVAADLAGERPGRRPTPSSLGARTCLSCDRIFFSSGPGNRLCTRCRGGDAGLAQL